MAKGLHSVELEALSMEVRTELCKRLEHCFDLMFEAVDYRMDVLREHDVRRFSLVPVAEYQVIRIYASDLAKVRRVLDGSADALAYVSFIGNHREGMDEAVEATDRALIGASPSDSPILAYFSLQDPELAWVNVVLFEDMATVERWVKATKHKDDWAKAASFFSEIEKSIGYLSYDGSATTLDPMRLVVRNYETTVV
ncbi:MAG: hypothetical protein KJO36_06740 [Acidimicrobiia bacterium]|nr:hypothetical protein [Acidimicrobiia bacterium]